jgi:hypothetical protein
VSIDWPYLGLHDANGVQLLDLTSGGDFPFLVEELDLGAVDVRDAAEDDPNGDGTFDYTSLTGSRGISATITAVGNDAGGPAVWLDRLRGLMHPSRRTYLHVQAMEWDAPRRLLVRGASAPHDLTDSQPTQQFQWKSPTGFLEAVQETTVALLPSSEARPGISFPISFPFSFPEAYPSGAQPFTVDGYLPTTPVVDIYGPCSGVTSLTNGTRTWKTTSALSIPAGTFWRVDPSQPSIKDPSGGDHYGVLDFTASDWRALTLSPGTSRLTFSTTPGGPGCVAVVRYRARSS